MASFDIYLMHCGQGDTLLLCLDKVKWILIDCNLPSKDAVNTFFLKLDELGILRFEIVCLSHPDKDHYSGMREVLERFTTSPRSVGTFCDSGFTVKLKEIKDRNISSELQGLYKAVLKLVKKGKIKYLAAINSEDGRPRQLWGDSLKIVSPNGSEIQLANLASVVEGRSFSTNDFSLVIILELRDRNGFRGLLTADAGAYQLRKALNQYKKHFKYSSLLFDFAKISHHGSWHSHLGSPVARCIKNKGNSVAAVSSSSRSANHPCREVLQAYLDMGWNVFDTGKRGFFNQSLDQESSDTLLSLIAWTDAVESQFDVHCHWDTDSGISAKPTEAQVTISHLPLYPSRGLKVF